MKQLSVNWAGTVEFVAFMLLLISCGGSSANDAVEPGQVIERIVGHNFNPLNEDFSLTIDHEPGEAGIPYLTSVVQSQAIISLGQIGSRASLDLLHKILSETESRDVLHQCEFAIDQVEKKIFHLNIQTDENDGIQKYRPVFCNHDCAPMYHGCAVCKDCT